ncbi:DUF1800 domain-containing protein [Iodobacter fluviatilis]|uniref:Protein of uncharacterized function (DUF1800) n=1 Tax=Iodobacter fluviatilis TaxID=537 RepID=A0A377Q4J4_9NEIS|nr:DUF1800 domain-containing protein [Iodobacter fluviatilis]TCU90647.1 uncharacterized protein (DUF1800 family) [Iodobacter fluviatilis]STQ89675.1 Protein of uncharacterised function (DUF1800) [Iodobacter fluviatilis]
MTASSTGNAELAAVLAASLALAACGGSQDEPASALAPVVVIKPQSDAEAARFLAQAGFGGRQVEINTLKEIGYEAWLTQQYKAAPSPSRWAYGNELRIKDLPAYQNWQALPNILWQSMLTGSDVLQQRMTLALSEIFVISYAGVDVPGSVKSLIMADFMDILQRNAFGNFYNLLREVTLSVAMGRMLGTLGNLKEDNKGRRPDENYAREVMQLFTIGLYELNIDGSLKKDAKGQPIETYNLDTVSNLARVFTGWTAPLQFNVPNPDIELTRKPMTLQSANHSVLEKSFLGVTIPAGTDGNQSLKTALTTLFNHPNVGPFIGKQLIQRFVCSNPSPAYISRVAAAFNGSGTSGRGDMKNVISAILLDPEARQAPDGNVFAGKHREPMIRLVQLIKTLDYRSPDGAWRLGNTTDPGWRLGQGPLGAASVFNFFRPGYAPPGSELARQGLVAPEMQIVSEISTIVQLNYWYNLLTAPENSTLRTYNDSNGNSVNDKKETGLSLFLNEEKALAGQPSALVERFNLLFACGQLSAEVKSAIAASVSKLALSDPNPAKLEIQKQNRVVATLLMVLSNPEYLVLK